jgi:hypothetical protein
MAVYVWLVTFLFLWASGFTATSLLRLKAADPLVRLAMQIALGLSIWPAVFLVTTTLGIAWTPLAMSIAVYATIAIAAAILLRNPPRRLRPAIPLLVTFGLLAILSCVVRVVQVRGLAFPPWVDGIHHGMIVRLLLEQGVVPATAGPYIPGAGLYYHWGFHVPAAFIAAATGFTEMPSFLLQHGQALNALTLLMVYAAGRVLLRSREGGLFAAALATFVSYYPAFYVSWGRYTHLAGTLILPPLAIALWKAPRSWRWTMAAALLAAGLLLIHVRVALFALAFAMVLLFATKPKTALMRWSVAAAIAAMLTAPWLIPLLSDPHLGEVVSPAPSGHLPMHLVGSLHNRELLAIATAGVTGMAGWLEMPVFGRVLSAAWWLLIVFVARREPKSARARRRLPWGALAVIGGWVLILAVTLHWRPFGLDLTAVASLDSAIITMFLPLSIAGAALISFVLSRIAPRLRERSAFAAVLAISLAGAYLVRDVVNPQTIITAEADLRALRWIGENVPENAHFAIDGRPWMPPAWVGIDGGYWIGVTTGHRTILPPLLYAWSLPRPEVERINALLTRWNANDVEAIRNAGVTHVYLGVRAKEEKRRALLADPRLRVVHQDGGAFVFELLR